MSDHDPVPPLIVAEGWELVVFRSQESLGSQLEWYATEEKTDSRGVPLVPWWPGGTSPRSVAAIVTEGESDALAALTAIRGSRSHAVKGIAVVSVPGTGFGADKLAKHLAACGIETVWLAFDADDAGRAASEKAARALAYRHIRAREIRLPQGIDLAECLVRSHDPARWLESALFSTKRGEEECEESRESTGEIPHHRDGRRVLFHRDELDQFIRDGGAFTP